MLDSQDSLKNFPQRKNGLKKGLFEFIEKPSYWFFRNLVRNKSYYIPAKIPCLGKIWSWDNGQIALLLVNQIAGFLTMYLEKTDEIAWSFEFRYKFMEMKVYLKNVSIAKTYRNNLSVGLVKNGYGFLGHGILKSFVSKELIDWLIICMPVQVKKVT